MSESPTATVAWIAATPVKGLRLHALRSAELTADGIPGDRAFFLVDAAGAMVSATRLGPLLAVIAEHDREAGSLALRLPAGEEIAAPVKLGEPEQVSFYGEPLAARPVLGPFSRALSAQAGTDLRLFASPPQRPGLDRGREGAVTLLSLASLERLRLIAGSRGPIDERRFRMTIGIDGIEAHGEDAWIGQRIQSAQPWSGSRDTSAAARRPPATPTAARSTFRPCTTSPPTATTSAPRSRCPSASTAQCSSPARSPSAIR